MSRVLCLNVTFEPVGFLPEDRAVCLLLDGRVDLVEPTNDGRRYRSVSGIGLDAPSVVRLNRYVKVPRALKEGISSRVLFARDQFTCQYCGTHERDLKGKRNRLTIDHIKPRAQAGPHHWENVVTACYVCNIKKRDRTPTQANMKFVHLYKNRSPKKPTLRTFAWGGRLQPEQKKWVDLYYGSDADPEFDWSAGTVGLD